MPSISNSKTIKFSFLGAHIKATNKFKLIGWNDAIRFKPDLIKSVLPRHSRWIKEAPYSCVIETKFSQVFKEALVNANAVFVGGDESEWYEYHHDSTHGTVKMYEGAMSTSFSNALKKLNSRKSNISSEIRVICDPSEFSQNIATSIEEGNRVKINLVTLPFGKVIGSTLISMDGHAVYEDSSDSKIKRFIVPSEKERAAIELFSKEHPIGSKMDGHLVMSEPYFQGEKFVVKLKGMFQLWDIANSK